MTRLAMSVWCSLAYFRIEALTSGTLLAKSSLWLPIAIGIAIGITIANSQLNPTFDTQVKSLIGAYSRDGHWEQLARLTSAFQS